MVLSYKEYCKLYFANIFYINQAFSLLYDDFYDRSRRF
jgi:hypothetical protein